MPDGTSSDRIPTNVTLAIRPRTNKDIGPCTPEPSLIVVDTLTSIHQLTVLAPRSCLKSSVLPTGLACVVGKLLLENSSQMPSLSQSIRPDTELPHPHQLRSLRIIDILGDTAILNARLYLAAGHTNLVDDITMLGHIGVIG